MPDVFVFKTQSSAPDSVFYDALVYNPRTRDWTEKERFRTCAECPSLPVCPIHTQKVKSGGQSVHSRVNYFQADEVSHFPYAKSNFT